jgi:signal transduction histidine kinase
VIILLDGTTKEVSITITDNGNGFILSENKMYSGLSSMKERADSINAQLLISSEPGVGTAVHLQLDR